MKKLSILLVLLSAGFFTSCEDDANTSNVSRVTNYPIFELLGDETVIINQGEAFTDPGVVVTEGDEEIEFTTSVTSDFRGSTTLDTNKADIYHIVYSATNKDGFSGTALRTVIVVDNGDLVTSISGLYRATVTRNGSLTAQYTNMEYILVWQNPDGTYQMSDGIGGYYAIGRGYGNAYLAGPTIITANNIPANDFSVAPFTVGTFGGTATMSDLTAIPAEGKLTFSTTWSSGYTFAVVLTKVQI